MTPINPIYNEKKNIFRVIIQIHEIVTIGKVIDDYLYIYTYIYIYLYIKTYIYKLLPMGIVNGNDFMYQCGLLDI